MTKRTLLGGLALAALSMTGCSTVCGEFCPYLIEGAAFELGGNERDYDYACAKFSFHNGSDKDVSSFTVSFMLYDSEGNNPFVGSNNVVERVDGNVPSGASTAVLIPMDDYLTIVPDEPYKIDFMYVRKIEYADGSEWTDPFGMYSAREVFE
jgi:hypothetical protein